MINGVIIEFIYNITFWEQASTLLSSVLLPVHHFVKFNFIARSKYIYLVRYYPIRVDTP